MGLAEQLSENIEKFSKAPIKHKVLGLVLIIGLMGVVFYFLFFSDLVDKLKNLENQANGHSLLYAVRINSICFCNFLKMFK